MASQQSLTDLIADRYASALYELSSNAKCIDKVLNDLLTIQECNHIVCSIKKVLNKSIKLGGSSINNYSMVSGKLGDYQNKLEVYGREGLICRKRTSKSKILRIVIAQRSTFYCPVSQK